MSFKWTDGTDYLAHHGIKGQKWGVRNGPPYPIDHTVMPKGTRINSVVGIRPDSVVGRFISPKDMANVIANARKADGRWIYTYNPEDEWDSKVYKGPFSVYLAVGKGAAYVAECQYETIKDLRMPTKKERIDEFEKLLNDRKYRKTVIRDISEIRDRALKMNIPDWEKEMYKNFDPKRIETKKDLEAAYALFNHAMEAAYYYGSTREYSKRMADKWDAMVDDNNQGVYNNAHDPVIIFRANEALKALESKLVSIEETTKFYKQVEAELAKEGKRVAL